MRAPSGEEPGRTRAGRRSESSRRFLWLALGFGALNLCGLIWVSRDGPAPAVASRPRAQTVWPAGEVGPRQTIAISFSQPVAAVEPARRSDPARLIRLEPAVPGVARWGGADQLVFQPAG